MVIKNGTRVFIPILGYSHDPDIYPNPELYDPDRFLPEQIQKRHQYAFLAFGEGPRNCIGLRFGMMQAKLGLASLLREFKFNLSDKMEKTLTFRKDSFILTTTTGLHLNVEQIK